MRLYMSYENRRGNTYGVGMRDGGYAHVRGWNAGVEVSVRGDKGERDSFPVYMTGGSNGSCASVFLGTVRDTEDGARWEPAGDPPSSIPSRVGSPSMEVVAAIPYGTEGREFKCVVIPGSQRDMSNPSYGVVSAYRNSDDDNRWHSTGGHYDLTLSRAVRVMAERAGAIIRPSQRDEAKIRELMETIRADAGQEVIWPEDIDTLFGLVEDLLNEATQ